MVPGAVVVLLGVDLILRIGSTAVAVAGSRVAGQPSIRTDPTVGSAGVVVVVVVVVADRVFVAVVGVDVSAVVVVVVVAFVDVAAAGTATVGSVVGSGPVESTETLAVAATVVETETFRATETRRRGCGKRLSTRGYSGAAHKVTTRNSQVCLCVLMSALKCIESLPSDYQATTLRCRNYFYREC